MLRRAGHLIVNISVLIPFAVLGIVIYFFVLNSLVIPTTMTDVRVDGPSVLAPGDIIKLRYNVIRNMRCTIDIYRMVKFIGPGEYHGSEFQIERQSQAFDEDHPVFSRPSGYSAKLPETLPPGSYEIFSRVRYYCNFLDYALPRVRTMPKVKFTVAP